MLSASLTDIHFSYLDVETTGLDPYSGDRICEISILKSLLFPLNWCWGYPYL